MVRLVETLLVTVVLTACAASPIREAEAVELPMTTEDVVALRGLDPELLGRIDASDLFDVRVARGAEDRPAVSGVYRWSADMVRFTPSFPWRRGVTYEVRYDDQVYLFLLPKENAPPTTVVVEILPSGDVLPSNLLRVYLRFSAPMSRGEAYGHVRIVDGDGAQVALPFLELRPELWDQARERLTLLFEPGRIKLGLRPHDDLGPPLLPFQSYTLIVDPAWTDGSGIPLASGFRFDFETGGPDRTSPDIEGWILQEPSPGTRFPLAVDFDESIDVFIAERSLWVESGARGPIEGVGKMARDGRSWTFVPAQAWGRGEYRMMAASRIEDLAGNALARPFETPIGNVVGGEQPNGPLARTFEVR